MKGNFEVAMKPMLAHEGRFSNHPRDPGGATMRGVTQRTYDGFRRDTGLVSRSVRDMTTMEYLEIYRKYYWDMIRGDELPSGVDYCVFDAAVNSGPGQAAKWLQRSLGDTPVDAHIGPVTVTKARIANAAVVVDTFCDQRLAFMKTLTTWDAFKNGWTKRVADVRRVSKVMATAPVVVKRTGPGEEVEQIDPRSLPPVVEMEAEETGKATASDTKTTETPEGNLGAKVTGTGIIGLLMSALSWASDNVALITGIPPQFLRYAIGGLVVAAFLGAIGFGVYSIIKVIRRKARGEMEEAI